MRNAVDASLERGGGVSLEWRQTIRGVEILVDDEGHGIANPANLFVPFFTTKPGGSGIGLFLSRQIAEAHGGTVMLRNRTPGPGCRACISPAGLRYPAACAFRDFLDRSFAVAARFRIIISEP